MVTGTLLPKLKKQAVKWRAENGYSEKLGVVIFANNELQGWCNELRDPEHWQPGCIAIDEFGLCYEAKGGNAQNGATSWVALLPHV